MPAAHSHAQLTADSSATRRNSTASEKTLSDDTYRCSTDKTKDSSMTFDEDTKTLSEHTCSSSHRPKMSQVIAKVKSKFSPSSPSPSSSCSSSSSSSSSPLSSSSSTSTTTSATKTIRSSVPPNYYPDALRTFEALSASRM